MPFLALKVETVVMILTTSSSLVTLEFVLMTTYVGTSDNNIQISVFMTRRDIDIR